MFRPVISSAPADYAIVGRNGVDREYDYETNTETKNYTYTGGGGVPLGGWVARSVFAAKFAERNFLFSNVIEDPTARSCSTAIRRSGWRRWRRG